MSNTSVPSRIISILAFLRILPSGKSRCQDNVGLLVWVILLLAGYVRYTSVMLTNYLAMMNGSIPGLFSLVSGLFVPGLQIVITIPALSYYCKNYPNLIQSTMLPKPQNTLMFFGSLALYVSLFATTASMIIPRIEEPEVLEIGIHDLIFFFFWTVAMILTSFVIGSSLGQFCIKADETKTMMNKHSAYSAILTLSEDLNSLKCGLSPILFMIYSFKCINIISSVLDLAMVGKQGIEHFYVIQLIAHIWDLTYITIIVDKTITAYKGLATNLR